MNSERNSSDIAQEYVTYEVTLPRGSEQGVALEGLATAFGWQVRERAAPPSDVDLSPTPETWRVTDEQLLDISTDVWGSEAYGVAASRLLAFVKKKFGPYVVDDYDVHHSSDGSYWGMRHAQREEGYTFRTTDLPALERTARRLWDQFQSPFAPLFMYTHGRLQPGDVTRERLAQYLRTQGKDRHGQHGTFGKAFDVMNVAAGLTTPEDVGAAHYEGTFIAKDEFESRLKSSGLSRNTFDDVCRHITRVGGNYYGYYETKEVVFEGAIEFGEDLYGSDFEYERVALESLVDLFRERGKVRPFVEGLIAERAAD